jgi:hypothetical protein
MRLGAPVVGFLLALGGAIAAFGAECKDDPDVVGKCFKVHGRFSGTVTGRIELAPVGRDPLRGRVFGVLFGSDPYPGRSQAVWMPKALERIRVEDHFYGPHAPTVYGEFEVCRLEPDLAGHMRAVCIQSAEHLVIVRDR